MKLGAEGRIDLGGGAGKGDPVAIPRDGHSDEALAPQPAFDGVEIPIRDAELRPELLRGEPLAILRRSGVLLGEQQTLQRCFLLGSAIEDQSDAADGGVGGECAEIVRRGRAMRLRSGENGTTPRADGAGQTYGRGRKGRLGGGCKPNRGENGRTHGPKGAQKALALFVHRKVPLWKRSSARR